MEPGRTTGNQATPNVTKWHRVRPNEAKWEQVNPRETRWHQVNLRETHSRPPLSQVSYPASAGVIGIHICGFWGLRNRWPALKISSHLCSSGLFSPVTFLACSRIVELHLLVVLWRRVSSELSQEIRVGVTHSLRRADHLSYSGCDKFVCWDALSWSLPSLPRMCQELPKS